MATVSVCLMSKATFCRSLSKSRRLGLGAPTLSINESTLLLGESGVEACCLDELVRNIYGMLLLSCVLVSLKVRGVEVLLLVLPKSEHQKYLCIPRRSFVILGVQEVSSQAADWDPGQAMPPATL